MDVKIQETINQLKAISLVGSSHENLSALCSVLYKPDYGWTIGACSMLRDVLVGMLEQLDPDEWSNEYLDEVGLTRLPVDADGEVIHIGDEMEGAVVITDGQRCTVHGFELNAKGEWEWIGDHQVRHKCKWWRRYRVPTVEDLLREFASEWFDVDDDSNLVAEYADRLKELIQDEQ